MLPLLVDVVDFEGDAGVAVDVDDIPLLVLVLVLAVEEDATWPEALPVLGARSRIIFEGCEKRVYCFERSFFAGTICC